jgi:cytoskeletal protein RodZ
MLEGESYKKVSDQIYLVPFLRRYANTLGLDGEDLAMRFVREFQYIENESARMAEPVMLETKRPTRRLSWIAILVAAIGAIALAKFGQSRYREQSPPPSAGSHSPSGAANPARPGASSANKPSSPTGLSPSAGPSAVAATQPVSNQPVGKPSANGVPSAAASAALLGPGQVPPPHGTASAKSEHQVSDPFASGDDNAANTE